jgi:hypothetical protein
LIGTAIHAGLAAYWRGRGGHTDETPQQALGLAWELGWPASAQSELNREELESQALKVLDATLKWVRSNMVEGIVPILVEQPLGADGHTTPDLVTREPIGLVVTDWKYSHFVQPESIHYRLEGVERTHQFLHYAWAVGEYLNEPVTLFRKVVIIGGPKIQIRTADFQPSPAALEQWLTGARQIWQDMAQVRQGTRVATMNPNGCKMYGDKWPCPMFEGCWTCHGNTEMMKNFYDAARLPQ